MERNVARAQRIPESKQLTERVRRQATGQTQGPASVKMRLRAEEVEERAWGGEIGPDGC